jgi:hypothetical protein
VKPVWNWGGDFFGYIDEDELWTHHGKHIGHLHKNEIYGPDGYYLGEVMQGNRLIKNNAKCGWVKCGFAPHGKRGNTGVYANYVGYAMYAGHDDFPHPDSF